MVDALRKCIAVLSVLLVLTTVRCMATCLVGEGGSPTHSNAPVVPPCHKHHGPAQGTPKPAPCQDHPGLLAYSIHQPSAQMDLHVDLFEVHEPMPFLRETWKFASNSSALVPPIPRSEALASVILRI